MHSALRGSSERTTTSAGGRMKSIIMKRTTNPQRIPSPVACCSTMSRDRCARHGLAGLVVVQQGQRRHSLCLAQPPRLRTILPIERTLALVPKARPSCAAHRHGPKRIFRIAEHAVLTATSLQVFLNSLERHVSQRQSPVTTEGKSGHLGRRQASEHIGGLH